VLYPNPHIPSPWASQTATKQNPKQPLNTTKQHHHN
jgi:hypothetical protein